MSVNITISAGESRPFIADFDRLPARVEVGRKASLAALPGILIFFVIFLVFGSIALDILSWPFILISGSLMVVLVALLGYRLSRPDVMLFDKDGVAVEEAGLFRTRRWQARYGEFKGVMMRRRVALAGSGKATYEIIELEHKDEDKILPLYVEKTDRSPVDRWQTYARLFSLPALENKKTSRKGR